MIKMIEVVRPSGYIKLLYSSYYGEDSSFSIKMIDISVSTFSVTKETQFSTFTVVSFIDSRLCKAFHKQLLTVTASRSSLGTQQEVSIKKQ